LSLLNRDFTEDDYELLLALDENNVVPPSQGANEDELPPSSCLSEEKEQVLKMEQNNTCAICLESFQAGETVSTMCCGHIFHSEELERWLKLKAVCPVCKCSIKKRRTDRDPIYRQQQREERLGQADLRVDFGHKC